MSPPLPLETPEVKIVEPEPRISRETVGKLLLIAFILAIVAGLAAGWYLGLNLWATLTNVSPILLAIATIAVALFTRELSKVSNRLAAIETQRDELRTEERKIERLREKLRLAEIVISWEPRVHPIATNTLGSIPEPGLDYTPLRLLAVLIDPHRENDLWQEVHGFLGALDKILSGEMKNLTELSWNNFYDAFDRIKDHLLKQMPEWRRDVALMLAGWALPPQD